MVGGGEGMEECVGKETSHFPLVPLPSYNLFLRMEEY